MTKKYYALGLMSGSSLDGLDIAACELTLSKNPLDISWRLVHGETMPFSDLWVRRLSNLPQQPAISFAQTNVYFGYYMADLVNRFRKKYDFRPDFIASHGHTIYHYPDKRFTCQIGDGGALAAMTGVPVVCDFRTQDVALDGEGTPIAPAADRYLFPGYDFYLNIGGIANITCHTGTKYLAFDTAPANQIFNPLAQLAGMEYDEDGRLAAAGQVVEELAATVGALDFYQKNYPKSLDNGWIRQEILPQYLQYPASLEDRICTAVHQTATHTANAVYRLIQQENFKKPVYQMLITGGGAFNRYLIDVLKEKCNERHTIQCTLPTNNIIEFKEAVLMCLMGLLRLERLPNCFASVTGARRDTVGGAVYVGAGF